MGMIVDIIGAVGNTPLIKLNSLTRDLKATVAVKMESMNPLGSVKDRIGVSMVREAEREKLIKSGHTLLVEPTSGNTGIALAFVAASRGYRLILTMPETMSEERRKLLLALGAEIVLTPGLEGMEGAIARAEQIVCDNENAYMLQQFRNKANPKVHRETTAEEIWRDSEGKVDVFVAGVGTGGTITGVGHVLKQRKPSVKIVAVEPKDSPVITQSLAGQPLQP
ncbi:MAG: pyridoxal-phosphate dependent enzyme, partial [Candidatus Obscuribacterales bacterium]|nr:pyridoxal-phosphate dependent enzyme [Candidatus Obscuribacterales bacterium]